MIMQKLQREKPDAQDVTKVRITAYSKENIDRAAAALSAGWAHHKIKRIPKIGNDKSETIVYCIMLWN